MKLLIVTEYYPSTAKLNIHGGIEARNFAIASYLAQKHNVTIIAASETDKPQSQLLKHVQILRVGWRRKYNRSDRISRLIFIFLALIKGLTIDFDVIEGSGFWGMIPAYILGFLKRKHKTILVADTIDAYVKDADFLSGYILKATEKLLLTRNWSRIICISSTIKEKVKQFNQKNLIVIYCGVYLDLIHKTKHQEKNIDVCCIARLVPYKQVNDLIEAVKIICQKGITVKCTIIGDGEEYEKLTKLIHKYNLETVVKMMGFLPTHNQVLKLLKQSKIFCLPSAVEGFGIATIEAMASGIPVILPKLTVHQEITRNKGVLYYKLSNITDLADKIIKLLQNKTLYNKLAKETLTVSHNYNWQNLACLTQKIYEDLCTN